MSFHLNYPVTSLSISPEGDQACLAAKRGLYIIDLNNPLDDARFLSHYSKWDVCDVQWNPHASKRDVIASTSNQTILIWNVGQGAVQYILPGHTRAINDFHWSIAHSDILASISNDSYIHIWDLRVSLQKPISSLGAWTGGSQVKFNPKNEFIMASTHDTDARIWDLRKGSSPLTIITAHMNKVYGIDWSPREEKELVTCAQDGFIKFWDYSQPRTCLAAIETGVPVWRARFTPFGNYIVSLPQRKDNNLYLWDCNSFLEPLIVFSGHTDTVKEFVWRKKGDQFQLVTWSKDQHLRLWPVDPQNLVVTRTGSFPKVPEKSFLGFSKHDESRNSDVSVEGNILHQIRDLNTIPKLKEVSDNLSKLEELLKSIERKFKNVAFEKVGDEPLQYRIFLTDINHLKIMTTPFGFSCLIFFKSTPNSFLVSHFDLSESDLDLEVIRYMYYNLNKLLLESHSLLHLESLIQFLVKGNVLNIDTEQAETENTLMEKVNYFLNDIDTPVQKKDTSDVFIEDVELDSDSSDNEISLLSQKIAAKTLRTTDVKKINVPFPRICQGCFSGGKLIYFFSILPHPAATRFASHTLTNKYQQPVLQSQKFVTYPKTYDMYESYRSFLLSRTGLVQASHSYSSENSGYHQGNTANYWLDEEDEEEEESISWRPNSHYSLQRYSRNNSENNNSNGNFLKQIYQSKSRNNAKYITIPSEIKELPKFNRRTTLSTSSVDIPSLMEYTSEQQSIEIGSSQIDLDGNRRRSASLAHDDRPLNESIEQKDIIDSSRSFFGANVYIDQNIDLDPISEQMAQKMNKHISEFGNSKNVCLLFGDAAQSMGRLDLAKIWMLLSKIFDDSFVKEKTDKRSIRYVEEACPASSAYVCSVVFQEIFSFLEKHRDLQTLAMMSLLMIKRQNIEKIYVDKNKPFIPIFNNITTSQTVSLSPEGIPGSSTTKKSIRPTSITITDRQAILPRANSMGAIRTSSISSYYSSAVSVVAAGNPMNKLVSGIGHDMPKNNVSYAAAVRNSLEVESGMVVKVYNQFLSAHLLNLFEKSIDQDGRLVNDISRFYAGLCFRYRYAECLQMWGLWYQRAYILKQLPIFDTPAAQNELKMGIQVECQQCGSNIPLDSSKCMVCSESKTLRCCICQISCHKMIAFCSKCQHGGHVHHYQEWFKNHNVCPSGCGCCCKL